MFRQGDAVEVGLKGYRPANEGSRVIFQPGVGKPFWDGTLRSTSADYDRSDDFGRFSFGYEIDNLLAQVIDELPK